MGSGRGSGDGKGGCDEAFDTMRQFAICVCIIVCAGPILSIIGIVYLGKATTDTRGDAISKLNAVRFHAPQVHFIALVNLYCPCAPGNL